MRIFISAGEPSGDLHGANFLRALRDIHGHVSCAGFGGDRMRAAGCDLLFPLADHAIMGLNGIVRAIPSMIRLRDQARDWIRRHRPAAVVLIDYPGFHWHLAKAAKQLGVPVVSFVPPQIWSWASHRVHKMRRDFDMVLCTLPFEEEWFQSHGIDARFIGHPYFDELSTRLLDIPFIERTRRTARHHVAILPGSRSAELDRNLESQIRITRILARHVPDVHCHFACFKESHRERVARRLACAHLPATAHVGKTPEILELSDVCAAVSGSVGLELIHHRIPSCIIYRVNPFYMMLGRMLLNVSRISLVNLLAGREIYPEFLTMHDPSWEIAEQLIAWLRHPERAEAVRGELHALATRVGEPGACRRAAERVADFVGARRRAA